MDRRVVMLGLSVVCAMAARLTPTATEGSFTAETANAGEVSLAALGAPADLTAASVGLDVTLGWAAGAGGAGSRVEAAVNGTSDDCTGAAFTVLADTAATTLTETTPSGAPGTRRCYRVRTTYGSWTSVQGNPVAVVRLGVVAVSVATANAAHTAGCSSSGQAGVLDCGDRVAITFNQPMAAATGPSGSHTVCTDPSAGAIVLGASASSGSCSATEEASVGVLAGGTIDTDARHAATFAWSNGGRTLTVTVGDRLEGAAAADGATRTFTAATGLQSATGGHGVCTTDADGGDCLIEATGGF
ncbi:MAG TPA: hypothetical protein VHF47_13730 [Acidimicrobiales bacterium]|nr:hypothetical protein [Acidimicrobiales bacterium]